MGFYVLDLLQKHFGYHSFREGQRESCELLFTNHDVISLMPTGGGKSLCYQLPALKARQQGRGPTLVISPLIALMDDQVSNAQARGIAACALHSSQPPEVQRATWQDLQANRFDLIYASPERAASPSFQRLCSRLGLAFLAIDEAHCMSQWGHDFRPEYMSLGALRNTLGVPTIALTATATPHVVDEIAQRLGLHNPKIIRTTFARPNLRFSVRHVPTDKERLDTTETALIRCGIKPGRGKSDGRAIVYCATRKQVERVAKALYERGFAAGHYHAGRTDNARQRAQQSYEDGRKTVLVATNAFGMGIDRGDVRAVIHFQTPASLEAYYQEAGRAGRDGLPAECVLLFGVRDLIVQRHLHRLSPASSAVMQRREQALRTIEGYARNALACRQQILCNHFTPVKQRYTCSACDVCTQAAHLSGDAISTTEPKTKARAQTQPEPRSLDANALEVIMQAASALHKPVGKTMLAKALRGSEAQGLHRLGLLKLPQHGQLSVYSERDVIDGVEHLLTAGKLVRKGKKYPTVWVAGRAVRQAPSADQPVSPRRTNPRRPEAGSLSRALINYRQRQARALKWKLYMVLTNDTVARIEALRPQSLHDLEQVHGIGKAKLERFGPDIIDIVRQHPTTTHLVEG